LFEPVKETEKAPETAPIEPPPKVYIEDLFVAADILPENQSFNITDHVHFPQNL
jgi:hypothetical protein